MTTRELERRREIQGDFAEVELPELPDVPGMIKPSEARYLYWLASRAYLGHGDLVELGSFLGKSAMHLAAGLRDGGLRGELYCFDRFVWDEDHAAKFDVGLALGDDYVERFDANLRRVYEGVHAHAAELSEVRWDRGPVEILFVDAPKRFKELAITLSAFAPHLEPELSLLAFQDFAHGTSYPVALTIAALGQRLDLRHVVAGGSTAGFLLREPLPVDRASWRALDFHRWRPARVIDAFEGLAARIRVADVRRKLLAGLPFALWDLDARDQALTRVRELELDEGLQRSWARLAAGRRYERYGPLFLARGIARAAPPRHPLEDLLRRLMGARRP